MSCIAQLVLIFNAQLLIEYEHTNVHVHTRTRL